LNVLVVDGNVVVPGCTLKLRRSDGDGVWAMVARGRAKAGANKSVEAGICGDDETREGGIQNQIAAG
jgi:hypothetical protein